MASIERLAIARDEAHRHFVAGNYSESYVAYRDALEEENELWGTQDPNTLMALEGVICCMTLNDWIGVNAILHKKEHPRGNWAGD